MAKKSDIRYHIKNDDWCYGNGNTIWNLDCRLVNIWFTGCACMSIVMTLLV